MPKIKPKGIYKNRPNTPVPLNEEVEELRAENAYLKQMLNLMGSWQMRDNTRAQDMADHLRRVIGDAEFARLYDDDDEA